MTIPKSKAPFLQRLRDAWLVLLGLDADEFLLSMVRRASRFQMLDEVLSSYEEYRKAGDTVHEAAWCALYDWCL